MPLPVRSPFALTVMRYSCDGWMDGWVVGIGRPFIYAYSTYGQEGVEKALQILHVSWLVFLFLLFDAANKNESEQTIGSLGPVRAYRIFWIPGAFRYITSSVVVLREFGTAA